MIRGKGLGLEIVFAVPGRAFPEALSELRHRLAERADFYRGSHVTGVFERTPSAAEVSGLRTTLDEFGLFLDGAHGEPDLEAILGAAGIAYLGAAPHPAISALPAGPRPARERRPMQLSEGAKSLVADFAGARTDLATRRTSRVERRSASATATNVPAAPSVPREPPVPAAPATLYHRGTLRGGQTLANVGHIVVVGDVNPGAELVAGGDILVFGSLRGVAHAGAQGDRSARVYALNLAPTQLRIATTIAADAGDRQGPTVPEEAVLDGERIAIVPVGFAPLVSENTNR